MTYSRRIRLRLSRVLEELRPGLVIYDTIRVGQLAPPASARRGTHVLYMDDLLALRYESALRFLESRPEVRLDPLGTFRNFVPAMLHPVLRMRAVQRWLLRLEKRRVRDREVSSLAVFDRCLLINERERRALSADTGARNLWTMKPASSGDRVRGRDYRGDPVFVVLGTLANVPHRASTVSFLENQMESIISRLPDVTIHVVGSGARELLGSIERAYPTNVRLEGFVEDLGALFQRVCAMLIPLLLGGGFKMKALTALQHGLPVISTANGVDGLEVRSGVDCIIEDDLDRYADRMFSLLNPELNARISNAGRQTFEREYATEVVYAEYDRIFDCEEPRS